MNSKYNLMLCELHHPSIHGKDANSDSNIETHYLVYNRYDGISGLPFDLDDEPDDNSVFVDDDIYNDIYDDIAFLNNIYNARLVRRQLQHPTIRNYKNIASKPNYIKPEIGQYIILPTQEAIAILKTFWLRIIQKKWKKIYQERKRIINTRQYPSSLYHRQIYGKWPEDCDYLPSLNGLFYSVL